MKYLFFDYDGTLTHNGTISDMNIEYLAKARAAGHKIFLNTGRSKGNVPDHVKENINWNGMICGSGYMEYEGKVLFEKHLSPDVLKSALDYAEQKGTRILFEAVDEVYSNHPNEWLKPICGFGDELRIINATVNMPLPPEDREIFSEAKLCELPGYFEITSKGIGKDTGLRFIEENLGVPHEDVIVFGDSENDIEMLKFAHTSVIMHHAPKFLDKYASMRTESDENGVAEALIKLLDI